MTTTTTPGGRTVRAAAALAAAACISIGALVAAPTASAAVGATATTAWIGGGTTINIRTAASTTSTVAYTVANNTPITIDCQLVGGQLGFSQYAGNRTWNKLTNGRYIHDAVTNTPADQARVYLSDGGYVRYSSTIPRCGAPAPVTRESRAVDWARSQLGVIKTGETSDGMWSGWCELFVERAYGTRGQYARAIYDYNAQRAAGRIHTDTNPPAGALVFYTWDSYGHVGISIGGGQVISTQGLNTPLPVRQHSVTGVGLPYLGWSYAPTGWPGR